MRGLSLLIPMLLAALPLSGATLYEAHFAANAGTVSLSSWSSYHSATAVNLSTLVSGSNPYRTGVINSAGASGIAQNAGYLYAQNFSAANNTTAATNYFISTTATVSAIAFNSYTNLSASWYQDSTPANVATRLAVQVNGNWYATIAQFLDTGNSANNSYEQKSLSFLSNYWYKMNFTAGSTLSLDTSTTIFDLSTVGTSITGLGFYIDSLPQAGGIADDYKTMRLDTLVVTGDAVPEPRRTSLLLAGFLLIFFRHRSRRSI